MANLMQLVVPSLGESVVEATIARWAKADGDFVNPGDVVAELETDKATVELPAGMKGIIHPSAAKGATVKVGDAIASIDTSATGPAEKGKVAAEEKPASAAQPANKAVQTLVDLSRTSLDDLSPAVRTLVVENKLQRAMIPSTGPGNRLTKEDVLNYIASNSSNAVANSDANAVQQTQKSAPNPMMPALGTTSVPDRATKIETAAPAVSGPARQLGADEEREEMSKLRQTIAKRLVESQHNTASLTTYNEVDMTAVMALREKYKESFEKMHGIGLGFMSFFAKAVVYAVKQVPQLNYMIDGSTVIKRKNLHLGVAVSTEKGLMVPVVRNAQELSMAQIEAEIKRLAIKARDGKITVDDMTGGTFTVTNGGVFGSLLSTPILNPPQSGILGMHKIEKRAVVVSEGGKDVIAIRPMMYLALTYDHRLVDGRQSVTFLVKVKEALEDPTRMLLDV